MKHLAGLHVRNYKANHVRLLYYFRKSISKFSWYWCLWKFWRQKILNREIQIVFKFPDSWDAQKIFCKTCNLKAWLLLLQQSCVTTPFHWILNTSMKAHGFDINWTHINQHLISILIKLIQFRRWKMSENPNRLLNSCIVILHNTWRWLFCDKRVFKNHDNFWPVQCTRHQHDIYSSKFVSWATNTRSSSAINLHDCSWLTSMSFDMLFIPDTMHTDLTCCWLVSKPKDRSGSNTFHMPVAGCGFQQVMVKQSSIGQLSTTSLMKRGLTWNLVHSRCTDLQFLTVRYALGKFRLRMCCSQRSWM